MRKKEIKHMRDMDNYSEKDSNEKLIINLRELSHTMRFLYEGKGSQKRILILLNESGVITQQELTKRLGIQPGSASEVISKLESAGLIMRTISETDRRTTDIALTETGKEFAYEASKQRNERHVEMFSCLSEDEKSKLLLLLEKINADWEERYQDIKKKHDDYHGKHNHHEKSHNLKKRG